jgi:hypothetical protein
MKKRGGKKAQVWIETVIYTLIGLVIIGLVLSFAKPKIEEIQDNTILQQSTAMMKEIDAVILTMGAAGNQRILEIGIKKGDLKIDGQNNRIIFEMESQSVYSEPNKEVNDGNIIILTVEKSGYNLVSLTRDYDEDDYDLQFDGNDEVKVISGASTSYKLTISNEGEIEGKTVLDMSID